MQDKVYQAAWKRFYVAKPRPDEGNGWLQGTQLVLMTSTGRLLSGRVKDRNGLAQGLREVLAAYARLPEAERRPWQELWAAVADTLARTQAKTTPKEKPAAR